MKIKNTRLNVSCFFQKKLLTTSVAAFCTSLMMNSVAQASDIDIYQQAKAGDVTLMLLLDISGSMGSTKSDSGFSFSDDYGLTDCGTASQTTLPINGNSLTSFSNKTAYYVTSSSTPSYPKNFCYVAASSASAKVKNTETGCEAQKNGSGNITGYRCYDRLTRLKDGLFDLLLGNSSKGIAPLSDEKVIGLSAYSNRDSLTGYMIAPARRLDCANGRADCDVILSTGSQRNLLLSRIASLTAYNGTPTANAYAEAAAYMMGSTTKGVVNSGFNNALADILKIGNNYTAPYSIRKQIANSDLATCSGQGIYVLTDGYPNNNGRADRLMNAALAGNSSVASSNSDDGWSSIQSFVTKILTPAENPAGLKIRTAVVGFGSAFNGVPDYDTTLSQQENIDKINGTSVNNNVKQAAIWGIRGEGRWYSGAKSEDVVKSINSFIEGLGGDIPKVTTGSPTIPKDSLNPSVLLKNAFYPQFQPTPEENYQLWAGNLKKYDVVKGVLKDRDGKDITDSTGMLVDKTYDLWARDVIASVEDADENTVGSRKFALIGGVKSQLDLRTTANTENRKLLTNRMISGSGATAAFGSSSNLRQVQISDLTTDYKYDLNRGYLISLLGYNVDAANPSSITSTSLTTASELRQVGAVMHSSPILVTNKGKIKYTNGVLDSTNRDDYVLFGTAQGLLHVVDAMTGKEKFAFVPNEMVENQKNAFLDYKTGSSGGTGKLYYGIDGPWTTYTEYVIDADKNLTVGSGRGTQKGKQFAYGGLRMGGRSYYALDLSNINSPKLQFQISPADNKIYYNGSSNTVEALKYMGQSWSKPTIAWIKWENKRKRVMFVGGGYDAGGIDGDARDASGVKQAYAGYENDTYNQTNKIGGGVYMFDAETGKLLWWASANASSAQGATTYTNDANLKYSVVSEIRAEDRDNDGLSDHLYFGDLGGQLFRIDLDNKATSALAKTPRLLLNLQSSTAGANPRFYEMPAFSTYKQAGKTFAVVSIGSGNRSSPLIDYTAGTSGYNYDAVYNVYDKDVTAEKLFDTGYAYLTTTSRLANLNEITQSNRLDDTTIVAPFTTNGWYYRFQSYKLQSAKVFATPVVLNYRMFVSVFDGSKAGLSKACGAGVKGESFLQQFCMPFGQCPKTTIIECSSGDGCKIGPGLQTSTTVDSTCDPTKEKCDKECDPTKEQCKPKPDDGTNNKNYCISTGGRGLTTLNGVISAGKSKICLIPQRWYELSR